MDSASTQPVTHLCNITTVTKPTNISRNSLPIPDVITTLTALRRWVSVINEASRHNLSRVVCWLPGQYDFVCVRERAVVVEALVADAGRRVPERLRAEVKPALLKGHKAGRGEEPAPTT